MNTHTCLASCLALCLLGLPGCASYHARPLYKLSQPIAPYFEEIRNVTFACRRFTKDDCIKYLDRDVISEGYQPVQITLHNNSPRYYSFSANGISLPCVPATEVADKVHTSTVGRATAYGVAGLFMWPFIIPAIIDGVGSAKANDQLDADFASKGAKEQIISPYTALNGLLFIPNEFFRENFTVTIFDLESKEPVEFKAVAKSF